MNKMQNETLHMKRTKEPRLMINDPRRHLINSIFLLFPFPFCFGLFFFFNVMQRLGDFRANFLLKITFKEPLWMFIFSHTC